MFRGLCKRAAGRALVCFCLIDASALWAQQAYKVTEAATANAAASTPPAAAGLQSTYRIGVGDVLHVSVWREDSLTQTVVVRTDGKITLPLVSEISVLGKTPLAVQQMLTESYAEFVSRPEVTVTVAEVNSQVVYILGEVQRPGAYPFVQTLGPLQLIARAGGLTPYAKKKGIYVLRGGGQRVTFNYDKLIKGQAPGPPVELTSGDTVVVP